MNGTGAGIAGSNAACSPYTSDVANRRFGCEAWCAWRNCSTAARSAGSFTDTETNSRLRGWYIRYVVSRSGNSLAHGAHHVAQKLIISSLPVPFCRSRFRSSAPAISTVTGAALNLASCASGAGGPDRPFTAHPTGSVRSTATGRPASSASIASRASRDLTRSSRALSSMRP